MQQHSIKSNLVYSILYQVLAIIIPLITTPYISRVLGAAPLGVYSYNYTIAAYFVAFAMLGLGNYGNREVAKAKRDSVLLNNTVSEIYLFQIIHTLFITALYLLYCFIFAEDLKGSLCAGIYVVSAFFDIGWILSGLEEFKFITIRSAIVKTASAACLFLFVKRPDDVYIYISIICLSILVSNLSAIPIIYRSGVRIQKIAIRRAYKHAIPVLILFVPFLGISIYKYVNKIILSNVASDYALGLFESSERLILVPIAFVTALGNVMLPRMSANYSLGINNTLYYFEKSIFLAVASTSAIAFGAIGVMDEFVPLFYGPGFEECARLIPILMMSTPFLAIANVVRTQCLIPKSKDKEYVISIFGGAIIDLMIVYFCIKNLEAIGAAIAVTITEFVVCGIQVWLSREEKIIPCVIKSLGFLICGLIMSLCISHIHLSENILVNLIIKTGVGGLMYVAFAGACYYYLIRKEPGC